MTDIKKRLPLLLIILISVNALNAQSHMKVYEHLDYINEQFRKFNEYETRWEVDFHNKKLIVHDKFQSMSGNILKTEVRRKEGAANMIGFYCLSGTCIESSKEQDNPFFNSYTMGLSQNIDEVLHHFSEIKKEFGGNPSYKEGNNSKGSLSNSDISIINENLAYINLQFSRYNEYNTVFTISDNFSKITCTDTYNSLTANISEVSMSFDNGNERILSFYCTDFTKCLKNSKGRDDYANYTMGLSDNKEPIYEAEIVIEKFAEIKELATKSRSNNDGLNEKTTRREYSNSTKANVSEALDRITEIFQQYNTYKHRWFVDWGEMYIYSKTDLCEVYIPIGQRTTITKADKGYYFNSPSKKIREKCTTFDRYTERSRQNFTEQHAADEVVSIFEEILDMTN